MLYLGNDRTSCIVHLWQISVNFQVVQVQDWGGIVGQHPGKYWILGQIIKRPSWFPIEIHQIAKVGNPASNPAFRPFFQLFEFGRLECSLSSNAVFEYISATWTHKDYVQIEISLGAIFLTVLSNATFRFGFWLRNKYSSIRRRIFPSQPPPNYIASSSRPRLTSAESSQLERCSQHCKAENRCARW